MTHPPTRLLLLLSIAAAGCGEPAELTVDLRTDFRPFIEFDTVQTDLSRRPFEGPDAPGARSVALEVRSGDDFLRGVRVAELEDVELGRSYVRVTLRDVRGAAVAQRVVDLRMDESYALTVVMTRNCRDLSCPGPDDPEAFTACVDGECVDPRCTPSSPEHCGKPSCTVDEDCVAMLGCSGARCASGVCLCGTPPPDGGRPDAGTDAGLQDAGPEPDAGTDAGPACPEGTACDDGDACTENDRCSAGTCAGTAVDCDDGNPCTDDSCSASSGCRNTARPEHSTCGAEHMRCCGGSCVNIRTDPSHCSGCGQACASGRACIIYDGEPACDCTANSECHGGVGQLCSTSYDLTCACTSSAGCVAGQTCIDRAGSTNYCTY